MSSFPTFLQKFRTSSKSTPVLLAVVTLLAYGLFAAQQGFHWDDWGFLWMIRFGGNERLYSYFSVARPMLAYLFMFTLPILGPNPLAWQIFALIWRAAAAIACWWALKQIFPNQPRQVFWVALLTLVYPGFSQHSIAIAYGHYSLLFTAFWLSLGLMVVALRAETRKWLPLAAALLLSAWSLFTAEYAFGMELLRPVFLWFVLAVPGVALWDQVKRVVRAYLPYLLVLISFVVWRVFIFGFHMYQAELFDTSEAGAPQALSSLPRMVMDALLNTSLSAWANLLDFSAFATFSSRLLLITLAILVGAFIFLLFYNSRFTQSDALLAARPSSLVLPWLILGLLGLLAAGIPFYVAGLPVTLTFPNDRFTISFAFGAASLVVGLIGLLPKPDYRAVALALLVALSMGKQIQFAHAFREDWELQKSFFWQLTWRAPQIEPHTALLTDDSAIRFSVDYSLAGPLNWTYHPDNPQGDVDIAYFFISTRLRRELPDLKIDLPIQTDVRLAKFSGSTNDLLVAQFRPPACLHILDPRYHSELPAPPNSIDITKDLLADGIPVLTARTLQALPLSNPSRILPDPARAATPPSGIFGPEPAHNWCYYFQQADLARQQSNWERVAALGDEAFAIPYYPNDASEFLPFIEAYLHLGRTDDARDLTRSAYKQMPVIAPALCGVWQRAQAEGASIPASLLDKVTTELGACPVTPQ